MISDKLPRLIICDAGPLILPGIQISLFQIGQLEASGTLVNIQYQDATNRMVHMVNDDMPRDERVKNHLAFVTGRDQ
ncbi:MAG: hypothetical protein LBK99_08380 [Opitutaceae bacterium]|jgi:hypothetical protein|nr:hypothetical protein [Opitutaceae bacterium]